MARLPPLVVGPPNGVGMVADQPVGTSGELRAKIERQTAELRTLGFSVAMRVAVPEHPARTATCKPARRSPGADGR